MATIQSATGAIETDDLGFTLMHEHVAVSSPAMRMQYPDWFDRKRELEHAVAKLVEARYAGVRTIVDLTPIDLGRDAAYIREAAERSGLPSIVATGVYYQNAFSCGRGPGLVTCGLRQRPVLSVCKLLDLRRQAVDGKVALQAVTALADLRVVPVRKRLVQIADRGF